MTTRMEQLRQMEKWHREQGYRDGYNGRPAASKTAPYQQGWRRGREARADQETHRAHG